MDLRQQLALGRIDLVRVGEVRPNPTADLLFTVVDTAGREIEAVSAFLRDLHLGDARAATCRSYVHDLLR